MKKPTVHAAALLLGAGIGTLLVHTLPFTGTREDGPSSLSPTVRSPRPPEGTGVAVNRMLLEQSHAMSPEVPLDHALDILFAEKKSPLRTRAFLKTRIQTMSTDELKHALMNGDVRAKAELREIGRRLALEDPQGTFSLLAGHQLRLGGMDGLYAFADALLQTWCDTDATAAVERLRKMERGGGQQDFSLRFSDYWAKTNPAAAAARFGDLVYLRNMQDQGAMVFTDNAYAEKIVRSWQARDEKGLRGHVDALPAGREREAFEKAIGKLEQARDGGF